MGATVKPSRRICNAWYDGLVVSRVAGDAVTSLSPMARVLALLLMEALLSCRGAPPPEVPGDSSEGLEYGSPAPFLKLIHLMYRERGGFKEMDFRKRTHALEWIEQYERQ